MAKKLTISTKNIKNLRNQELCKSAILTILSFQPKITDASPVQKINPSSPWELHIASNVTTSTKVNTNAKTTKVPQQIFYPQLLTKSLYPLEKLLMTIKTAFPREQSSALKKLLFTLASNALNAKIILTLRPKSAETAMVAVTSIKIQTLAQCLKLLFQTLMLGKTRLSFLMINSWTTLTKTTKNSKTRINLPSAQATSPTSTIMSAYLALKELCFLWRKRLVELAKAILSSTKLPITAKKNLSTPTYKIPTGQVQKLTLKSKRKSMKRPKTRFI